VRRRHLPLPDVWLFTDERLGGLHADDLLWRAIDSLPRGGGIVFRHHGLVPAARRTLALAVSRAARAKGLVLVLADPPAGVARHGVHNARHRGPGARGLGTASAHTARELHAAFRNGADVAFLSPVFATRSHPGAPTLGPLRFGLLARAARGPVVPLGGMNPRNAGRLNARRFAAIDHWVSIAARKRT